MSKKHYTALAKAFASALSQMTQIEQTGALLLIRRYATVAAQDNPRFDVQRFYAACGLDNTGHFAIRNVA